MTNIALYDDHPAVAHGLKPLIESGIKDVSCHIFDDANALKQSEIDFEVVVLDIVTPDVKGLEFFDWYRTSLPHVKVIAYSSLFSPILLKSLHQKGVKGYVNKRDAITSLIEAIETVSSGSTFFPDDLHEESTSEVVSEKISNRELEILAQLSKGKITKEISTELFISTKTIDNHKSNLFKKFKASNTIELLQKARELGYVND